jgi:cytochrome c peroxidase
MELRLNLKYRVADRLLVDHLRITHGLFMKSPTGKSGWWLAILSAIGCWWGLALGGWAVAVEEAEPAEARATRVGGPRPRTVEPSGERRARIAGLRAAYARPPAEWPAPVVEPTVRWVELGPLPEAGRPADDPALAARASLGERLFFDPRLSGSGQIACASCHDPDLGWADGRTTAFGHDRLPLRRNTPTVMGSGLSPSLFWDGRAASLEEQAEAVIRNPDEMHSGDDVVGRLAKVAGYPEAFEAAFGPGDITVGRAATALASFERTLVGGRSRFDAFLKGDADALSDDALAGLDLFRGRARCMNCHHGPNLTDGAFHDLGLSYYGRKYEDLGRHRVTGAPADVGRFRTPSLRNVVATAPYMHNGLFDLDGVLRMYNAGMATLRRRPEQADDPLFPTKDPLLKPLGLNEQELADLRAFLNSLSEPRKRVRPPELPGLHGPPPRDAATGRR